MKTNAINFARNLFNVKFMRKLINAVKRNMKVSAERGLMNCTGSIPLWAVMKQ